jgi:serine/threonine-protein kinase RsbW/stage II sporulation protein AB (anti-sigma F factor)
MTSSPRAPALDATFPAQPAQVPAIRRAVAEIARECGAAQHTIVQIKLAVSEAATNAVLHAYRDAKAAAGNVRVVVRATQDSGLDIRVRDEGIGPLPRRDSPGLGLGLDLMARDADSFELRAVPGGGTEVVLRFAL